MNLKSIEGKAKLYYGICSDYPNCNFQEDQLINFETEKLSQKLKEIQAITIINQKEKTN